MQEGCCFAIALDQRYNQRLSHAAYSCDARDVSYALRPFNTIVSTGAVALYATPLTPVRLCVSVRTDVSPARKVSPMLHILLTCHMPDCQSVYVHLPTCKTATLPCHKCPCHAGSQTPPVASYVTHDNSHLPCAGGKVPIHEPQAAGNAPQTMWHSNVHSRVVKAVNGRQWTLHRGASTATA